MLTTIIDLMLLFIHYWSIDIDAILPLIVIDNCYYYWSMIINNCHWFIIVLFTSILLHINNIIDFHWCIDKLLLIHYWSIDINAILSLIVIDNCYYWSMITNNRHWFIIVSFTSILMHIDNIIDFYRLIITDLWLKVKNHVQWFLITHSIINNRG